MAKEWQSPLYEMKAKDGQRITIDVTMSVNGALEPSSVLTDIVIPHFRKRGVRRVLDFGAGAFRHTLPLLRAGFEVCAVEFERAFTREACADGLKAVRRFQNFTHLVWPQDYLADKRTFDAALLCYVLQTMPIPKERDIVLRSLRSKLKDLSFILYMSRYNQGAATISPKQRVSDGFYMWPKREHHSFYREFDTQKTHDDFAAHKFNYIRSLSQRGTDQMFLYAKGVTAWA